MKNMTALVISLVLASVLTGCADKTQEAENGCLEPVSPDSISRNVYQELQDEWDWWNSLSTERKTLSSHMPGYCWHSFDSWEDCEEFLGFTIPNPLEGCSGLEQATYAAMPLGFQDAPCVQANWYGTEDGYVERITVETGYRSDEIRVMMSATLYGDPADMDSASLQTTSDSTENYFAKTAYQADGAVLYRFHVVGEADEQTQVEAVLEQIVG